MTSANLPIFRVNADYDLSLVLPAMETGTLARADAQVPSRAFRVRGICDFFLEGLPRLLHADLQRSGTAYRRVLDLLPSAYQATHRSPLFDAIACGDLATATEIARRARTVWSPDEEYEDDFLYLRFLMDRFLLGARDDQCAAILDEFSRALDGQPSERLDLCRALLTRDGAAFDTGLDALLLERERHYRAGAADETILEEAWATEGMLSIEGLALVDLASRSGLETRDEYLFIPSLALEVRAASFDPDSWRLPA